MGTWAIKQAADIIIAGGVIAYPTEAVYGLGCNPFDVQAVMRLLGIKRRDPGQGVILIGHSHRQFSDLVRPLDRATHEKIMAHWPGPVTWLLPASADCPRWLRGEHNTLAVRVTAHKQTRRLCGACGLPLVSTSANRHGQPAARTALQVRRRLGDEMDMILAGPTSGHTRPSEIRDAHSNRRIR